MKRAVYTRDVILIMIAAFFYMFCSMSTVPIVAGYAESIGASGIVMGIVSALTTGIAVVCRPITGNLSDRIAKVRLVVTGCILMFTAFLGYVLVPNLWFLIIMRCLQGAGYACCSIGMSTWLTMLLPKEKMGSGVGVYGTINALAMAVSPTISIRTRELWGYHVSFLIAAAAALIALTLSLMIRDRGTPVCADTKQGRTPRRLVYPLALPIALALALISIPYTANKSFLVSYVENTGLAVRPDLFFTLYAVTLVLLRVSLRKLYDKVTYPTFLLLCSFSMIGSLVSLCFMKSSLLMLIGAIFMAGSYGIMYSVSQSAIAAVAPADQRGIAMGTYYLGLDVGSAIGPIVGGFLYGHIDLRLFYPLLCVFAIGCIGMYFICRTIYQKPHDHTVC